MADPMDVDQYVSALIAEAVGVDGDVVPSLAAAQLVAELRELHPEILQAWLDAHAEAIVRDAITARIRMVRARARAHAAAGAFARAAKRFEETGDVSALSSFEVRYVVDGSDTQRRVGEMTAADCRFVADRYELSGNRALMLAAFHRAVAHRIGNRTVADVFSEDAYDRLYRSITGHPAAAAS